MSDAGDLSSILRTRIRVSLLPAIAAFCAGTLLAGFGARAEDLALPEREPPLAVTSEADLGTRVAGAGLAEGATVPPFSVQTAAGEAMTLSRLLERAPLLIVFYRGGWCPYCNVQIRQLTKAYPEFRERGVEPVLISVDRPSAAALAERSFEIPFPVLSDPDLAAHEAFDVVLEIDAATRKRYAEFGIDLEKWSGRKHHKIARTSAFLIARDGRVEWAHVSDDYKTRPSPEQLLAVIDAH